MNRSVLVITGALVLCAAAILGALFIAEKRNESSRTETYEEAPPFSLPDSEGNSISLTEVDGKVKIINFWASWSPYSKEELETLIALKDEYGKVLDIVALSRDHNKTEAVQFLESNNLQRELTFVFDEHDDYFNMMEGYAVPESIFLNKDGEVVFHEHKPLSYEEFEARVTAILE